jgi:hypothetical protein
MKQSNGNYRLSVNGSIGMVGFRADDSVKYFVGIFKKDLTNTEKCGVMQLLNYLGSFAMKKCILIFALVLTMCLSLVPLTALAAVDLNKYAVGDTVEYFGKKWVIIGLNGTGVASSADTVTLLLANAGQQNMYTTGNYFNKEVVYGNGERTHFDITEPRSHDYGGSDLQAAMDGAAATLTDSERAQIVPRDFEGGADDFAADGGGGAVAGNAVTGALFWALSSIEAEHLDASILDFYHSWWLRSPGKGVLQAAEVTNAIGDDGLYKVFFLGSHTSTPEAVRPACIINLATLTSDWAVAEIDKATELGLVPDILKGQDLTKPITRAEFAAVSVKVYENLAATTALPATTNPFTDTKDLEVLKAYNVGVTDGTSPTTFDPAALLNREQAATMLTRVFKRVTKPGWTLATDADFALDYTKPAEFADDGNISDWAKDSVYFMAANNIISGTGSNNFSPKAVTDTEKANNYASATREQALVIAVRMVENLK